MKALVGAFNQEKALVGAFSVIVKTGCGTDGALHSTSPYLSLQPPQPGGVWVVPASYLPLCYGNNSLIDFECYVLNYS